MLKQLDNDMYLMQYDNGDKFSVGSSFLFTQDLVRQVYSLGSCRFDYCAYLVVFANLQMEKSLKAGGATAPADQDTEMEDAEQSSCAIM